MMTMESVDLSDANGITQANDKAPVTLDEIHIETSEER